MNKLFVEGANSFVQRKSIAPGAMGFYSFDFGLVLFLKLNTYNLTLITSSPLIDQLQKLAPCTIIIPEGAKHHRGNRP